ncbi:hypothetical protein, partial [Arthrobacter sp. KK5.5]|uniref:hypothetical protein n=1 Tax=Arthrobacter sp. KK5.5 TaxID=3373084 RepID=UPI003EE71D8C
MLTREGARRRAGLDADEVRLRAAAVEAVHRERLAELTELARTSRGVYRPWAERLRAEFAETDPKVDWWATAAAATEL